MNFDGTARQFRERQMDMTVRLGWESIQTGDSVLATIGREALCVLKIKSARSVPLQSISPGHVARLGFVSFSRIKFIERFCKATGCQPQDTVRLIEFEYAEESEAA